MTDKPNPMNDKVEISGHPTDHSRKAGESDIREDKTVPFWCVRAREHIEGIPHDCKALEDKWPPGFCQEEWNIENAILKARQLRKEK